MKLHYKVKITGKVQGVWYRKSTQEKAHKLGISGFVRNETDGSVYAEAEGEKEQLTQLLEWCKQGPEQAKVEKVVHEEGELKHFKGFVIER